MKYLVISTLLVFILFSCNRAIYNSQSESIYPKALKSTEQFPFQVLHAENVFNKYVIVDRYAYLSQNDTVKVENGHLILVHYSGKFLEFDQDTVLITSGLEDWVVSNFSLSTSLRKYRPDLKGFIEKDYFFPTAKGVTTYCGPVPEIEIQGYRIQEHLARDISLSWDFSKNLMSAFQVDVKNIFDEVVLSYSCSEPQMLIDLSEHRESFEGDLVIIEVNDSSRAYKSNALGIKLVESLDNYIPGLAKASEGIDFLELAYYHYAQIELETAKEMLERSTELSDRAFYADISERWK